MFFYHIDMKTVFLSEESLGLKPEIPLDYRSVCKIGRQVITNRKVRGRSPYRVTGSTEDSGFVNLSSGKQTKVVVFVSVNMVLSIFLCILQVFSGVFLG
jgi:hypothetical protein